MVGIDRVGDVARRFSWNTHQETVAWINGQSSRQVRHNLVGQATARIIRWYAWYHRVVDSNNRCRWTERRQVRTCNTNARNRIWTITNTVIVGIWVAWVGTRIVAIKIESSIGFSCIVVTITVIVQVLFETRCADWVVGSVVITRQDVRHSVPIQVFQDFEEEGPRRACSIREVRPHRVGRIGHDHVRCAPNRSIACIELHTCWQGWRQAIGCSSGWIERCDFINIAVVQQNDRCINNRCTAVRIWTCNTDTRYGEWTVTDSITIGVWIEWIGSRIARINVGARIGFNRIEQAIRIIVRISNKTRCWPFGCIVIAG